MNSGTFGHIKITKYQHKGGLGFHLSYKTKVDHLDCPQVLEVLRIKHNNMPQIKNCTCHIETEKNIKEYIYETTSACG